MALLNKNKKSKAAAPVKTHTKAENRKRRIPLLPAMIFTVILTQIGRAHV